MATSSKLLRNRAINQAGIGCPSSKPPAARNKIRHWLNEQESEKAIELGRKVLEKEARKYKQNAKDLLENEKVLVCCLTMEPAK